MLSIKDLVFKKRPAKKLVNQYIGLYIINKCKKMKQQNLFYFIFSFFIFFSIILYFSIFRTLGLGLKVIGHTVTSVTSDSGVTTLITEVERKEQKVLEQSDVIQYGHHMLTLCFTHGHFRVRCTVASMDHLYKYIRQTIL